MDVIGVYNLPIATYNPMDELPVELHPNALGFLISGGPRPRAAKKYHLHVGRDADCWPGMC